jgi:hypothetical protein
LPNEFHDRVGFGKLARGGLGVDGLAVGGDLKSATAPRNELQRGDILLKLEQFFRQTDGVRLIVSHRAVFDRDV